MRVGATIVHGTGLDSKFKGVKKVVRPIETYNISWCNFLGGFAGYMLAFLGDLLPGRNGGQFVTSFSIFKVFTFAGRIFMVRIKKGGERGKSKCAWWLCERKRGERWQGAILDH